MIHHRGGPGDHKHQKAQCPTQSLRFSMPPRNQTAADSQADERQRLEKVHIGPDGHEIDQRANSTPTRPRQSAAFHWAQLFALRPEQPYDHSGTRGPLREGRIAPPTAPKGFEFRRPDQRGQKEAQAAMRCD